MQAPRVVAVDEARQVAGDVLLALERHGIDALDLQRLHEACMDASWFARSGVDMTAKADCSFVSGLLMRGLARWP